LPKWSRHIIEEVTRNLVGEWSMPPEKARRREDELRKHFPEAWVEGYEPLLNVMANHPKDRHVLAAAVHSSSELIVTFDKRHFPVSSLLPWEIELQGPSMFLRGMYELDSILFVRKLHEQAANIGMSLGDLLVRLEKTVASFVRFFREEQGIDH